MAGRQDSSAVPSEVPGPREKDVSFTVEVCLREGKCDKELESFLASVRAQLSCNEVPPSSLW